MKGTSLDYCKYNRSFRLPILFKITFNAMCKLLFFPSMNSSRSFHSLTLPNDLRSADVMAPLKIVAGLSPILFALLGLPIMTLLIIWWWLWWLFQVLVFVVGGLWLRSRWSRSVVAASSSRLSDAKSAADASDLSSSSSETYWRHDDPVVGISKYTSWHMFFKQVRLS